MKTQHELNPHQELAIIALSRINGDDSTRCRLAFSRCTPEQMQEEYGQSGKTRAQILSEYKEQDEKINAAIDWIRNQK